jgi:hypothetical protein
MGVVIFGNIGSDKKQEYETVSCPHCQQVKAIVIQGCTKNIPYRYWCPRCREPICEGCAEAMEKAGQCPGPFVAKAEEAMKRQTGGLADDFVYQYHSTSKG